MSEFERVGVVQNIKYNEQKSTDESEWRIYYKGDVRSQVGGELAIGIYGTQETLVRDKRSIPVISTINVIENGKNGHFDEEIII